MKITKNDMLNHATRFDFSCGHSPADLVRVEKNKDYWVIKWGGSRWSKKHKMFVSEPSPSTRTEDFIEETKFFLDEAFMLASSNNLIKEHEKRLKELKLI